MSAPPKAPRNAPLRVIRGREAADRGFTDVPRTAEERLDAMWRSRKLRFSGPAMQNRDFRDLFAEFNAAGVEYLLVGAHALAVHGHIRATRDLIVWVRTSLANADRVLGALHRFGAPTQNLVRDDFAHPGVTLQIGVDPLRIDILTAVDGVQFDEAWSNHITAGFADQTVNVISKADLIRNKREAGRLQDLADVEALERPLE